MQLEHHHLRQQLELFQADEDEEPQPEDRLSSDPGLPDRASLEHQVPSNRSTIKYPLGRARGPPPSQVRQEPSNGSHQGRQPAVQSTTAYLGSSATASAVRAGGAEMSKILPAELAQQQHHMAASPITAAPTVTTAAVKRMPLTGGLRQLDVVTETI